MSYLANASGPVLNRRGLLKAAAASSTALLMGRSQAAAAPGPTNKICAFVKFIQSLSHQQMAQTVARLGYDGIEATIRRGGQIAPEHVVDELPKLVEALADQGLEITIMTTDVNRADDPLTQQVLRTAAAQGIRRYRMAYYRYDLERPVRPQLESFRPAVRELAALNRELGLTALYQNHAGAGYVGASLWDLELLLDGIPPEEIGVAYDIRHATAEGGQTWPVTWNLVRPRVGAVYFKDFTWHGRRPENVPLGSGQVDPAFARLLRRDDYRGPISVHVEYLERAGLEENIAALASDLKTLRGWLAG